MQKKWWIFLILVLYIAALIISATSSEEKPDRAKDIMTDVSRLMPVKIREVIEGQQEQTFQEIILKAKQKDIQTTF